jgi:hypothetical protein
LREISGLFVGDVTRGDALADSRFAPGYYRVPFQGTQLAAAPNNYRCCAFFGDFYSQTGVYGLKCWCKIRVLNRNQA